ncbi:NUDIX domain-containing protein [Microbacterium indicum]|uniref:NUDIX domain-containing protein n=1 Tax=Microbacterium indicum TaxID=358100 RepID=UPI0003FC7664|nr:NUDIX hydrolase [Microbacterium indicum]
MTTDLHDEPFEVEVMQSDLVFDGHVWDVREDRFRYGDAELVRHYVDHPGAVAIAAVDDERRILLIQQYRHPIRTRDWEVPAGLLDVAGEDPRDAAARELAEEADLDAAEWERIGAFAPSPGGSSEVIPLFLATGLTRRAEAFERHAEEADIRPEWVPLDEAVAAVLDGRISNAMATIAILVAAERLRDRS